MFIDLHCDTATKALRENQNLFQNNCHLDFKRLKESSAIAQVFAVFVNKAVCAMPYEQAKKTIDFFYEQLDSNKNIISLVRKAEQLKQNMRNGQLSALLSIEGGEVLEGNMENLYTLHKLGVCLITLTWNYENEIGYGAATGVCDGLKDFGRDLISEMNRLGIIVDVSHLNDKGFSDVAEISTQPFVASHSNSRYICGHRRNLNDSQIKVIAEKGGVIGINGYPLFLSERDTNIEVIVSHLEHIINVGGSDVPAFGFDFDGIDATLEGFGGVADVPRLQNIIAAKFGDDVAEKTSYANALRVVDAVL